MVQGLCRGRDALFRGRLPRWPLLAAALVAVLLAIPAGAGAQTPPATFDANGVLTTPVGTFTQSDLGTSRCLEVPLVFSVMGASHEYAALCVQRNVVRFHLLSDDRPPEYPDVMVAGRVEVFSAAGDLLFGLGEESSASSPTNSQFVASTIGSHEYVWRSTLVWSGGLFGNIGDVGLGDQGYMQITYLSETEDFASVLDTDIPDAPSLQTISRNEDYDEATLSWMYVGPVIEYEVDREQAITIEATDTSSTQYGNTERFLVPGTVAGVDEYVDSTVDERYAYRYRVRARRGANKWGDWSARLVSGGKPGVDLDAPANFEVARASNNSEVVLNWTAPAGDVGGYAVQRQELVEVGGSTLFANTKTLTDSLSSSDLTYTDSSIAPGRTYEYRVAATEDGIVGDYADWARVAPFDTSLGAAPGEFKFLNDSLARILGDRREFRMGWDPVDGADDYEVDVLVYGVSTGTQEMETHIVSDPEYFRTSYGRVDLRVRARKKDDTLCGDGDGTADDDEVCHSDWSGWYSVRYTPEQTIDAPDLADDTADTSIMELRENVNEAIESGLGAAGAAVDAGIVLQLFAVLVATALGAVSIAVTWRVGMAPLGVGMAFAIVILVLFNSYRLLGIPLAWPVALQTVLAVAGAYAGVRQLGVLR